jgi:hypothetical protein
MVNQTWLAGKAPFINYVPIETLISKGCPIATFDYRTVITTQILLSTNTKSHEIPSSSYSNSRPKWRPKIHNWHNSCGRLHKAIVTIHYPQHDPFFSHNQLQHAGPGLSENMLPLPMHPGSFFNTSCSFHVFSLSPVLPAAQLLRAETIQHHRMVDVWRCLVAAIKDSSTPGVAGVGLPWSILWWLMGCPNLEILAMFCT